MNQREDWSSQSEVIRRFVGPVDFKDNGRLQEIDVSAVFGD